METLGMEINLVLYVWLSHFDLNNQSINFIFMHVWPKPVQLTLTVSQYLAADVHRVKRFSSGNNNYKIQANWSKGSKTLIIVHSRENIIQLYVCSNIRISINRIDLLNSSNFTKHITAKHIIYVPTTSKRIWTDKFLFGSFTSSRKQWE